MGLTRKVTQITEELCGTEFSSLPYPISQAIDPIVNASNNRSLAFPVPVCHCRCPVLKVREEGRVRTSMMLAYGVNADGYREILDLLETASRKQAGVNSSLGSRFAICVVWISSFPITMAAWCGLSELTFKA